MAVDILKINGRVVGEYLVKGGLTRHQIAGARCWTSSAGWNTIRRSDGSIVKYWDTRNHRVCRTGVGPSGVQVVGCGNYYWPQSSPPRRYVTVRHPVVVKSFQNMKLTGKIHVSSTSFSTSVANASAVCVGGGSGSGYGKGTGSSTAASWLKFTFKTKTQMIARATQVRSDFELSLNIDAYAKAKTSASSEADAKATCTPVWPPGDTAPSVNIGNEACTAPGGSQGSMAAVGTNNDSVTRTLIFHLSGGPTSKPDVTKTVAAGDTAQVSFTGLSKGLYTVKVTVEETGLSASASASIIDCDVPPPVDNKPVVNIMGSPAHLYVNGNAYVWIEASDSDGDSVTVHVSASGAATVSGLIPVDVRWDGTPCPTNKSCFRATVWAKASPGDATITATVTANGLSGEPDTVTFPVKPDEF